MSKWHVTISIMITIGVWIYFDLVLQHYIEPKWLKYIVLFLLTLTLFLVEMLIVPLRKVNK